MVKFVVVKSLVVLVVSCFEVFLWITSMKDNSDCAHFYSATNLTMTLSSQFTVYLTIKLLG